MTEPLAYSPRDFSRLFGIGKTKLYEEIKEGRLIARKVGSRTIILAEDARSWLRALPIA